MDADPVWRELESLAKVHRADQSLLAEVRAGTVTSMQAALLRARVAHEELADPRESVGEWP